MYITCERFIFRALFRKQHLNLRGRNKSFREAVMAVREANYSLEAENYENKNHARLHRMQAQKLRHNEGKEEHAGQTRA